MEPIRWEDPPTGVPEKKRKWVQLLEPLLEHPKRWAVVATFEHQRQAEAAAYHMRARKIAMPPGQWEGLAKTVDSEYRLYARYLGPDEDRDGGAR
jgi:hypothetical protein